MEQIQEPISDDVVEQWFSYFEVRDAKRSEKHLRMLGRIKELAIAGNRLAKANEGAVMVAVAKELRELADLVQSSVEPAVDNVRT